MFDKRKYGLENYTQKNKLFNSRILIIDVQNARNKSNVKKRSRID